MRKNLPLLDQRERKSNSTDLTKSERKKQEETETPTDLRDSWKKISDYKQIRSLTPLQVLKGTMRRLSKD